MPRTKGAANLSGSVQLLIGRLAMELPYLTVSAIRGELEKAGVKPLPGEDAIRKIARNVRAEFDEPWSLGISEQSRIPPEATATLLKIWRTCLFRGHKLTVREAKWVVRLQGIPTFPAPLYEIFHTKAWPDPEGILMPLFYWAQHYSLRERVVEALHLTKERATPILDGFLAFAPQINSWSNWEYEAATHAGLVPELSGEPLASDPVLRGRRQDIVRLLEEIPLAQRATYILPGSSAAAHVEILLGIWPTEADQKANSAVLGYVVEEGRRRFLSEEEQAKLLSIDAVYAMLLQKVGMTTGWNDLSYEGRRNVAGRLYSSVTAHAGDVEANVYRKTTLTRMRYDELAEELPTDEEIAEIFREAIRAE